MSCLRANPNPSSPAALTYLKKEIAPRLSNLVDRAIDAAELLIWENEDVVLVEMGGAILHEMMVQFRQANMSRRHDTQTRLDNKDPKKEGWYGYRADDRSAVLQIFDPLGNGFWKHETGRKDG